jgi:exodeoxyribonuclease VII small subunit
MSDKSNGMTYEQQMEELTEIVDQIGREDCPVDELESRVRRAADLIRGLRARLAKTELAVSEVLRELDKEGDEEG